MITSEAEAKLRYRQIEREADSYGRIIGVRRLRPSEVTRLVGYTPELGGYDTSEVFDEETGTTRVIQVPHRGALIIAAAVCELAVDGQEAKLPFPRNRKELDALYDRLDGPGLNAAVKALGRLSEEEKRDEESIVDSAKNS
jgi:hypothetical protein